MKNKSIVLISLILLILLTSSGAISASDIKEINANDDHSIDPVQEIAGINDGNMSYAYASDDEDTGNDKNKIDDNRCLDSENTLEETKNIGNNKEANYLKSSNLQSTITVDGSAYNQMNDPTIQTAINNAKSGDTIIITGTDYVHCHFIVDKQLTIISKVGTKMSPCPSNTQGSGTYGVFYVSPEASGTIIQGFTLTNNINSKDSYGILVREASDVEIRNCTINSTKYGDGIRIERSSNTMINDSLIKNSNIGIHIVNSAKTKIRNNNITNNTITGIYIGENNTNTTVHTNNITYNRNTGINMGSADYVYILNNFIAYNRNGDTHNSTAGAGVYVNCNITKVEIKGNFIKQNGLYGVLNDYRARNIDANRYAELLEVNTNNYYLGHSERLTYHIEYRKYNGGPFNYDSENDLYVFVGNGNGTYDIGKSVVYLGYAFFEGETICGATLYSAPNNGWGYENYKLKVSEISQSKKGVYSVSIVDAKGNIIKDISSIYVTFYLNKNNTPAEPQSGDIFRTVLMQNGTATADFTDAEFKESGNVITAVFPGLYESYKINPYATFNVSNEDIPGTYRQTKVNVSSIKLVPLSGDYFAATLTDENGNAVVGEKLTFKISGVSKTYTKSTDENGQARLQINLATQKTYTVTVSFAGSENYNKSSAKATLTIKKQSPKIISSDVEFIPASGEYYTVSLKDENGKAIANKKISFSIGSKTYNRTTDENGQARLQINLATQKTYTIITKSQANSQYNAVNKTNRITIKSGTKKVKLTVPNAKFVPKSGQYYNVTLKDEENNPLAGKKLIFSIGSNSYAKTTDNDGQARLQINLAKIKSYPIAVKFAGDDVYNTVSSKANITIAKGNAVIKAYDRTFSTNSMQAFSAFLIGDDGNALANKEIDFIIDSKNYAITTNSEGFAELEINLGDAKAYTIISQFLGDDQYNPTNKTNRIAIENGEKITYIDANLPNEEIQRILDGSPENYTSKFLGEEYNGISLIINKSQNIISEANAVLNGKDGQTVFTINAENVTVSNFRINANSSSSAGNGILINNSKNIGISNNIVKNVLDDSKLEDYINGSTVLPGTGIILLNSSEVNIENNKVSSFESALYAEASEEFNILENEFTLSNYGIKYGFGNAKTEIMNNTIKDNIGWYTQEVPEGPRGYGIFLNNSAAQITINQNNISNNYMGISIDANNSTGIVITSNFIADNSLEGIRFNAPYDLAENAVEPIVTDNAIYRNAEGPSMMILGEMSANPEGIYGPGADDESLRLKIDPNWYGVNTLRTWDYESGIVGVGTMCPRIKSTTINFTDIVYTSPGTYRIDFYKNGELATNLATFDIYATLNRGTDKETEVHLYVVNGTGTFSFEKANYLDSNNKIEISVGSLINVVDRIYTVVYAYNVPESEIPI